MTELISPEAKHRSGSEVEQLTQRCVRPWGASAGRCVTRRSAGWSASAMASPRFAASPPCASANCWNELMALTALAFDLRPHESVPSSWMTPSMCRPAMNCGPRVASPACRWGSELLGRVVGRPGPAARLRAALEHAHLLAGRARGAARDRPPAGARALAHRPHRH